MQRSEASTRPVLLELVRRSVGLAASISELLEQCEAHFPRGIPGNSPAEKEISEIVDSSWAKHTPALDQDEFRKRVLRVVSNSWSELVRPRGGRRPDVLGLVAQLLANPLHPHTIAAGRFAIVLGLRTFYEIPYNPDSLRDLSEAYRSLRPRFADQQRRRLRKAADRYEQFLLDLASLSGSVYLSLSRDNLNVYYRGFIKFPLGIDREKKSRLFAKNQEWPELHGNLPDLSHLLNLAFAQPSCVPGLDEVTGGLIAAVAEPDGPHWNGGLVTLVAGAPGSGKTTLCLSIAARMADLGSVVRYITTEEETSGLRAKLLSTGNPSQLGKLLIDAEPSEAANNNSDENGDEDDFAIIDGRRFASLESLVGALDAEFKDITASPHNGGDFFLVFPRAIVIDSLTALRLQDQEHHSSAALQSRETTTGDVKSQRALLASLLNDFRRLGVCVFLIGSALEAADQDLAFLVDNVFILDQERIRGNRFALRTLTVQKTRLQGSQRGRHILHLSRYDGCTINPSLHSVLRDVHERILSLPAPESCSVIWVDPQDLDNSLTLRCGSQVLVYGRGPAGKARYAMYLAFEPKMPMEPKELWQHHLLARQKSHDTPADQAFLEKSRVLVVSFLYRKPYYEVIARDLFKERFRNSPTKASEAQKLVERHLTVHDLYPGFLDPETLVSRVQRALRQGRLEGRPYSAVIVDGIHNMILQFPMLEHESLLWPTLSRMLRAEGVDTISTFTFFRMGDVPTSGNALSRDEDSSLRATALEPVVAHEAEPGTELEVSQKLFFHLLVSNCDYTFIAERPLGPVPGRDPNLIRVVPVTTSDPIAQQPAFFHWDPRKFSNVNLKPTARRANRSDSRE